MRSREVEGAWAVDRDGEEVCLTVTGVYVPYVKGTYYDPPEGGFVEDIQAENEYTGEEVILTEHEEQEVARMLFENYEERDNE